MCRWYDVRFMLTCADDTMLDDFEVSVGRLHMQWI